MRLLSIVFRYFLLLSHPRAGDILTRCIGQQGYEIYMCMSYCKVLSVVVRNVSLLNKLRAGNIFISYRHVCLVGNAFSTNGVGVLVPGRAP